MKLCSREREKLMLFQAGRLAQNRLARGLRLNHPETVALIAMQVNELAREGTLSVAQIMDQGRIMLGKNQTCSGVKHLIGMVQVEATFRDGTKLVTVDQPICREDGDLELAMKGSFLPVPELSLFQRSSADAVVDEVIPGEVLVDTTQGDIVLNEGRTMIRLRVANKGDRPVQVGSHYHFSETNKCLEFDRALAAGKRLNIPAGTAVRFEPDEAKMVTLVEIAGNQIVRGGNNLTDGKVSSEAKAEEVAENARTGGFNTAPPAKKQKTEMEVDLLCKLPRQKYAELYGPTVGDRVRLGNTNLILKVEKDYTQMNGSYGDECVFGGGKVLREGMGMAVGVTPTSVLLGCSDSAKSEYKTLETVLTNALIVDYTGIYKADIGLREGNICGIGKAGNPDTMKGVDPTMVVSVNTECIAAEGLIVTAGGFDAHVHFICPQLVTEALESGITTMLGGGTGPATGTNATTCTPAPEHIRMMLKATDAYPVNFGFTGKGNSSKREGLQEVIDAGAVGLKLHEDWGTTPAAIDMALTVAEENDVQVNIHTDTLNESACCEDSIEAFKGRTIHTYHSEGAGGGHAPDIIRVCGEANVIPSSTNPTRPFTVNTIDEHLDMLMVCHHLKKNIKEDVSFAESRIRAETIAAEDILQDLGAISIISSDSQAMGRQGEVICRTWQTAHKMKLQRGDIEEDNNTGCDNHRIKRYIAKYTINPAIAHGMSDLIGSVETGKLADLVLWKPGFFGIKPEIVIKGGTIAYAQMGDANASVPTCEPVQMKEMFGAKGKAVGDIAVAFVSKASISKNIATNYGLSKTVMSVSKCRGIGKKDMKLNNYLPDISVDPETYKVVADGVELTCAPLKQLPLAQTYNLF